jgi:hypothetical protein
LLENYGGKGRETVPPAAFDAVEGEVTCPVDMRRAEEEVSPPIKVGLFPKRVVNELPEVQVLIKVFGDCLLFVGEMHFPHFLGKPFDHSLLLAPFPQPKKERVRGGVVGI